MTGNDAKSRRTANLATPSCLGANAIQDIAGALNALLADVFALYLKTKNFHWHMSGPHFRDYHLLLDEQADQIFAMTDADRRARAQDRRHDAALDRPHRAAAAHPGQRRRLRRRRRTCWPNCARTTSRCARSCARRTTLCDEHRDVATASLIENWIDETERRTWFLFEAGRTQGTSA